MNAKQFKNLKKGDILIGRIKCQPMFYGKEVKYSHPVDGRYIAVIDSEGKEWYNTYVDFIVKK